MVYAGNIIPHSFINTTYCSALCLISAFETLSALSISTTKFPNLKLTSLPSASLTSAPSESVTFIGNVGILTVPTCGGLNVKLSLLAPTSSLTPGKA